MWSLGCILVELDAGVPLFSAKNEQDLLTLQLELLGLPPIEVLGRAKRGEEFFSGGRPLRITDRKGKSHPVGSKALRDICRTTSPAFLDFVEKCLTWDPDARMTPEEALEHPWVCEMEAPKATSSPKYSRVNDLIGAADMDMLNDSGVSSGDEQEVPNVGGSKVGSGWSFEHSPMSAVC
jgi:dual specificity tyrosine-phosphorylation-regulated kinase 2/3/4